ncbi:hypothetical protein Chelonae_p2262 [[Mycobacterium] chelonae subsp. bovistauri]|nr:hypothetical protein Chelonae_p2262 [Mycobacterium sp. QIA-37]
MDALRLVRCFAGFVRQGYPLNTPAVGHCALVALMPSVPDAEPDPAHSHQN